MIFRAAHLTSEARLKTHERAQNKTRATEVTKGAVRNQKALLSATKCLGGFCY